MCEYIFYTHLLALNTDFNIRSEALAFHALKSPGRLYYLNSSHTHEYKNLRGLFFNFEFPHSIQQSPKIF